MNYTASAPTLAASDTSATSTSSGYKTAGVTSAPVDPAARAVAHAQAAKAHSAATARHKVAAVSGVGTSADHQAAIAQHNIAVAAHQTAANAAESLTSAPDVSLAGHQALQASGKAEGHSLKALAASGYAPQAAAAHQASTKATQSSMNAVSAKPLAASGMTVTNLSKRTQMATAAARMAASAARTPAGAARQFVDEVARSAPLRYLWRHTAASVAHLPLHQQMNHLTALINRHGFKTTALHAIQALGSTGAFDGTVVQAAAHFVGRMLSNPQMMKEYSSITAGVRTPEGLRDIADAVERFLKDRGYKGNMDHFHYAYSHALVNQGRRWAGQYGKTYLITGSRKIPGPSLTVENGPSGLVFRLDGSPIANVTTSPASEFTTKASWPATGDGLPGSAAGAIAFSMCKAHDDRWREQPYHGPMFTGTLTFTGTNSYGIQGTAKFQGMRTGAVAKASPANVSRPGQPAQPASS